MGLAKPLVITAGEPAGVGPELCNALVNSPYVDDLVIKRDVVVVQANAQARQRAVHGFPDHPDVERCRFFRLQIG